jgi:hypothetical protein
MREVILKSGITWMIYLERRPLIHFAKDCANALKEMVDLLTFNKEYI